MTWFACLHVCLIPIPAGGVWNQVSDWASGAGVLSSAGGGQGAAGRDGEQGEEASDTQAGVCLPAISLVHAHCQLRPQQSPELSAPLLCGWQASPTG